MFGKNDEVIQTFGKNDEIISDVPMFSMSKGLEAQDTITPTDIITGTIPFKSLGIFKNLITKPQVLKLLPDIKSKEFYPPKTLFDVGARIGAKSASKDLLAEFLSDPRTYLPTSGIRKAEIPLQKLEGIISKPFSPSYIPGKLAKTGAFIAGVDKGTLEEAANIGYRNILNKKYYNKKIPEQLSNVIESNVEGLEKAAKTEYDIITNPLRDIPFNFKDLKNQIMLLARQLKNNPFKGASRDLNMNIVDGISSAKVKNWGDILDLRRNLDEVLYTAKGQGIKSQFGKAVRDKFNEILHQNDILKNADEMWYNLERILKDNKKVLGETGENYLKRWSSLTTKQKEALAKLEMRTNGQPFIQDLTNWSLAQEFLAKPGIRGGIFNAVQKASHPILRSGLRMGGAIEAGKRLLFKKP